MSEPRSLGGSLPEIPAPPPSASSNSAPLGGWSETAAAARTPIHPTTHLGLLDRVQPALLIAAIALGLGAAQVIPDLAGKLEPLVALGVFWLIYLVMLGVRAQGVAAAFTQRRFLSIAVGLNFVVNPLLAWGLGSVLLSGQPELRVGLLLFLVTPCIGWYLIFTELAGGDAELGVGLLGINIVLQVLLLPLYLWLFAGQAAAIDLGTITQSIAVYLVAPLALATVTRWALGHSARTIEDVQQRFHLPYLKTAVLMVVIVAMFASQGDALFDNPGVVVRLIVPMVAFFALAFALALAAAKRGDLPHPQAALLVFTTTSRNSEASLAIAATAFASPLVGLAVVIGPVIELPLLVLMVRALLSRHQRSQHTHPS